MAGLPGRSTVASSETLGSPATLSKIPAGSELTGLTLCPEKGAVVLTVLNTGVAVQSVNLRQTLSNLTFPKARVLSCAAISHNGSYYACVQNPTELVTWTQETKDFTRCGHTAITGVASPITAMHAAADRLFLCHEDGAWTWLPVGKSALTHLANPWQSSAKVAWSGVIQRDGRPLLTALYLAGETYQLFFADPAAEAPALTPEASFLSPTQRLLACTIHRQSMLLTLWADGSLRVVYFANEATSTATITAFILRFSRLDHTRPAQLVSINGTHALIFSSEGPAAATATLVDTEYGTVQGSLSIGAQPATHAVLSGGQVVYGADSQVWTLSVFCEEISLANAIGKLVPQVSMVVEPARADNTFTSFVPKWSTAAQTNRDTWLVEQTFIEQRMSALVTALSDTEKLTTLAAFDTALASYEQQLREVGSPMPQAAVAKITSRILAETKYFANDALKTMIKRELVHYPTVPHIFETLLRNKHYDLCELAIVHVAEVPETEIVRCLSLLLPAETLTRYLTEAAIDRALLAESPLEKILRACMTRSWTEELLVSALVALPVQHALIVLAVVLVWFRRHCFHSPTHLAALHAPKTVPTMGQTVEWMTCLLDAHYAAFILTESSHQLLQVLQYDLAQQTAMCERAGDLTGILDSITKPRKPKPTSAFYSVEKLEY
eukprot:m.28099 g.28099  ORF g.28099 m.28099 type:complete len:668 (-) comp9061_c0_seq1:22-2025(-)